MKFKNNGLTLVEVLVAAAILSVMALSVNIVFKSGIDAWSRAEMRLDIYQNGRVALSQISQEIVGAFATDDATTKAKLVGTAGVAETDPDELEFITDFADSVHKIRYRLVTDSMITTKKALERSCIDYNNENPDANYYDTPYANDPVVKFVPATTETAVSNIKFKYLQVMAVPTGMADWGPGGSVRASWPPTVAEKYDLPEAIKIILTLKDANSKDYVFETIVYLPNSE